MSAGKTTSLPLANTLAYVVRTTPATPSATAAGRPSDAIAIPVMLAPTNPARLPLTGPPYCISGPGAIRVVVESALREPNQRERAERRRDEPGRRVRDLRAPFLVDGKPFGAAGFHRIQRRQKRLRVATGRMNGVEEKSQLSVPAKVAGGLHEGDRPCQLGASGQYEFVRRREDRTSDNGFDDGFFRRMPGVNGPEESSRENAFRCRRSPGLGARRRRRRTEVERRDQPRIEDGALAEELGVIGQRAQPGVLHAFRFIGSLDHVDRLLRLLSGLFRALGEDVFLFFRASGNLQRDLFCARRDLRAHWQRTSVGEHDRLELQEDIVERREITTEHGERAPLLRHARAQRDVAEHPRTGWHDDAVVGEEGVDEHRLDRLADALDDHATIERHPQRRALFHNEPKRRGLGLGRCG